MKPAYGDLADVRIVIEIRHQELHIGLIVTLGRRNRLYNGIQKRTQIRAFVPEFGVTDAGFSVGVENRKFDLMFIGAQVDKQIVGFIDDFLDPRVGPIDFIND